ncbi:hypothetical protein HDU76_007144 [Blyttiomyces sp. JEL0837]|nr:hypothetical protein HDU76_007144 [Blyttiomyces sp. JEL0837]
MCDVTVSSNGWTSPSNLSSLPFPIFLSDHAAENEIQEDLLPELTFLESADRDETTSFTLMIRLPHHSNIRSIGVLSTARRIESYVGEDEGGMEYGGTSDRALPYGNSGCCMSSLGSLEISEGTIMQLKLLSLPKKSEVTIRGIWIQADKTLRSPAPNTEQIQSLLSSMSLSMPGSASPMFGALMSAMGNQWMTGMRNDDHINNKSLKFKPPEEGPGPIDDQKSGLNKNDPAIPDEIKRMIASELDIRFDSLQRHVDARLDKIEKTLLSLVEVLAENEFQKEKFKLQKMKSKPAQGKQKKLEVPRGGVKKSNAASSASSKRSNKSKANLEKLIDDLDKSTNDVLSTLSKNRPKVKKQKSQSGSIRKQDIEELEGLLAKV